MTYYYYDSQHSAKKLATNLSIKLTILLYYIAPGGKQSISICSLIYCLHKDTLS